jgi:PAS domain S-box-containing protein
MEESRSKFADLYDFAPVGYLTLDEKGRILEANLTAATLLGVERGKFLNSLFPLHLAREDRPAFRQLLNISFSIKGNEASFISRTPMGTSAPCSWTFSSCRMPRAKRGTVSLLPILLHASKRRKRCIWPMTSC